jgi:hypothetical protein
MKLKIILFLLIFLRIVNQSIACDVCGCSLGGYYMGILPQFNKNFIGLRWSQNKYYAYMDHQSQYLKPEYSNDTYNKIEIWSRFYVGKRWQVFAFVPYSINHMDGSEQKVWAKGIGDISILANYIILNTGNEADQKFKHTLTAGGGIKLPTGNFKQEQNGLLVNPNFQLGTGSVDFLMSAIYTVRYTKLGLNAEGGYKYNLANSNDYKMGNQWHVSSQLFYWQKIKTVSFLPNAGLLFEQGEKNKDGRVLQTNTGGNTLLVTAGLEIYYKKFTVGFNFKKPIHQNLNSDAVADIQARNRIATTLTYNF